jgi:hypothetical protein
MVLWMQQQHADAAHATWEPLAIAQQNRSDEDADLAILVRDGAPVLVAAADDARGNGRELVARLVRFARHGVDRVALLTAPPALWRGSASILLNGFPPLGVVTLEDRDEILVHGEALLFAANAAEPVRDYEPAVDAVAGGARALCARCHLELHPGDRVKACAGCGAPAHEGELAPEPAGRPARLLCASYDRCCGACGQGEDELVWHPEGGGVCDA